MLDACQNRQFLWNHGAAVVILLLSLQSGSMKLDSLPKFHSYFFMEKLGEGFLGKI